MPEYRYLKGYAIDPGFSTRLETMNVNECVFRIKWEKLWPGPIGEYIEVIDYDPVNFCIYEPVDLNNEEVLSQQGLTPSEGNAQFHQQFVYAVIMQTIANFEKALGRKLIWRRNTKWVKGKIDKSVEYVHKLRVYPHAMIDANAFYTPEKVALLFGYFQSANRIQGSNFPGGTVFTCLSPDIVAHETTHAILDSIFPRYLENTNPDVPAFHEAFADIVALLQRFSNTDLLEHQIGLTSGKLDEYSVMGELATQFGQALETGRGALRSAIGRVNSKGKWERLQPDPQAYQKVFEAHDRGAILVATFFDAFMRLYNFRVRDLFRIATQGTGVLPQGAIHPDLVKRLAKEAAEISSHLLSISIRALDYCPPFDITYGDYLRALITADSDLCENENNGYRVALIEAFRAWGIFPENVNTLSTYSLKWKTPDLSASSGERAVSLMAAHIKEDIRRISRMSDRKMIAEEYQRVQAKLQKLLMNPEKESADWKKSGLTKAKWQGFLEKIGVVIGQRTLKVNVLNVPVSIEVNPLLEVHSVRPAFRQGKDNSAKEQVIIALTQSHKIKSGPFSGVKFRGGATLVLSIKNDDIELDYIILKSFNSEHRLGRQINYQLGFDSGKTMHLSSYEDSSRSLNLDFQQLHLH